ncbi:MAG: alpha/beta hydrolase [bacterium]|nr:alpha/beta hydrolase [bacterium]
MIPLWERTPPGYNSGISQQPPSLTPYVCSGGRRGAVVVCPGGGYSHKAEHEGAPVALWLNSIGISAFVLDYRVAPYRHPCPLTDAARAIRCLRCHADRLDIYPDRIGIIGFSAGGHLAASAGTLFDNGNPAADDPVDRAGSRPDAMILCYPVISFGDYRHHGSMTSLLGDEPDAKLRSVLSLENSVTEGTSPAFIWHTASDAGVPVENSLLFARALSEHRVPFELHIFPAGGHGLGLAEADPDVSVWTDLCGRWLVSRGFTGVAAQR